jgi:hypothetical protein
VEESWAAIGAQKGASEDSHIAHGLFTNAANASSHMAGLPGQHEGCVRVEMIVCYI